MPTSSTTRVLGHLRSIRLSKFAITLGVIALVGLTIRIVFTVTLAADLPFRFDPQSYHLIGTNLAHGVGYVRPPQLSAPGVVAVPTAEFPPLFPGLIAFMTLLGLHSVTAQSLFMCFVGTSTVVLVGLAGRRIAGTTVGCVAAAIAAVHPLIFQPDGVLMSESLYMALVSGALLAALVAVDRPDDWRPWALLGALIGFAALTRTEALFLVPVLSIPLALRRGGATRHSRARATAIAIAASIVVVAPWTLRNALEFDRFVPVSTNTGTVLAGANCYDTYHGVTVGSWRFPCIELAALTDGEGATIRPSGRNEAEIYDSWRGIGVDYLTDHIGDVPRVEAHRILRTWGLWDRADELSFDVGEARNRTLQTIGYWLARVLLPFAIAGAVIMWRRRRPVWVLLAPCAVATIVTMIGYGSTRMRAGAEPALAILTAISIVTVVRIVRAKGTRATIAVAATPTTGSRTVETTR